MITINPGTHNTADGGYDQAYSNIKQFITDCEIPLFVEESRHIPEDNGRYYFKFRTPLINSLKWEVEMPSLPIEQVRYTNEVGQNAFDFPRLYVDGSSWLWKYAIIKKELIIEQLEYQIEELQTNAETLQETISELQSEEEDS